MIPSAKKTLLRFDRRVWLLLFAMLAFRFGHGLYFPFSSIYFHNVLGIPLTLVGTGLAVFAAASVLSSRSQALRWPQSSRRRGSGAPTSPSSVPASGSPAASAPS